MKTKQVLVRLPVELDKEVAIAAIKLGWTKTRLVEQALRKYLRIVWETIEEGEHDE